jgi:1-deoxy-D-xylulose-5-phosphate reductoisomerase
MRVPIQYAFSWPDRLSAARVALDLPTLGSLTFRAPDESRFPALRLVREAAAAGGTRLVALGAADEVAVASFLAGKIAFPDIVRVVADVVERTPVAECDSVEAVLAADAAARGSLASLMAG